MIWRCFDLQYARKEHFLVIRLDDGEPLLQSTREILGSESITGGVILSISGMISNFELGWYENGSHIKDHFENACEILNISGTINIKEDGKIYIHAHAAVAGRDLSVFGGHLFGGIVRESCEIIIQIIPGIDLIRKDPSSSKTAGKLLPKIS